MAKPTQVIGAEDPRSAGQEYTPPFLRIYDLLVGSIWVAIGANGGGYARTAAESNSPKRATSGRVRTGANDPPRPFKEEGHLDERQGLDHEYPRDTAPTLARALAFVSE